MSTGYMKYIFIYFHAQMRCGLIFCGSDPESESILN